MDQSYQILTGRTQEHLQSLDEHHSLHAEVIAPFERLRETIRSEYNLELSLLSSYRSFDRQKIIWNEKVKGQRAVLDDNGDQMDLSVLSAYEKIEAIMRFSALPGFSRHHWGTDMDVYDQKNAPEKIELIPEEYGQKGPFYNLTIALNELIAQEKAEGFIRPYDRDRGGVAIEPWHLTHAATAEQFQQALTLTNFEKWIFQPEFDQLELIETIRENHAAIFNRFIDL